MSTLEYKISVMQAFQQGKGIEYTAKGSAIYDRTSNPQWDWINFNYRVKKEKKLFWSVFRPEPGTYSSDAAHSGGCWFATERECRDFYATIITKGYQVISIEIEV